MIYLLPKYIGKAGRGSYPSFNGFGVKKLLAEDVGDKKQLKLHQINHGILYSFIPTRIPNERANIFRS